MRICDRCKKEKEDNEFPVSRRTGIKSAICRRCKCCVLARSWAIRHPERKAAHAAVYWALKEGRMTKPKLCNRCGKDTYLVAHHADYSRELDVEWLCDRCHGRHHQDERVRLTSNVNLEA